MSAAMTPVPLFDSQCRELCAALGWQGGTYHQVLAEVKRLRADWSALQTAIVGNSGASAILTVESMRADLIALRAQIKRGAVPEGDDGKRVLREVFALCEDTEVQCSHAPEDLSDFNRGRAFEAKGIARAIGAWYQEQFCGRTHMGEPAASAPDHFRDDTKMIPAPAEVSMPEPIGFIDSNDDETWATLTQNAHELATLKLRSTVFHVSQMRTYGAACRAAGEAAGYARGRADEEREWIQAGDELEAVALRGEVL